MTLKAHNGSWYVDAVLVYKSYSSEVFNGVKVLKETWIEEIREYRFIVQHGQVKNNEWVPVNGGKTLSLATDKDLNSSYDQKWTKDTLAPVKGDILEGTDSYGKRVLVLFEDNGMCHRLTKMNDTSQNVSSAPLDFYKRKLSNLKIVNTSSDGKPFSSIR